MTNLTAPCFSPSPSEGDDRATSPALSSSSRTTTSIPTDVSDISSLDGDDYEVIDGPVPVQEEEADDHMTASLFHSQHGASIASEIDGSSFLAPYQHDEFDDDAWRGGSSLHASTSLATLSLEPDLINSQASSQLRFPDPLDESFQEERPSTVSSAGVQCSDSEDDQSDFLLHPNDSLTPRIKQTDEPFIMQAKSTQSSELDEPNVDDGMPIPGPVGIPFNWNKKLILANVFRAVMGLIVIIVSTGVLPVWPGSTGLSKQVAQSCHGQSSTWLESLLGHTSACPSALTPSKALIVPARNGSSVLSSMTSLMTRPTSKALRASSRSKELSMIRRECNALSLYMTEVRKPQRANLPICLDYVDGAAVCHSVRKIAQRKGRAAKANADIITASARKKWHNYVEEMSEWLHDMTFTFAKAIRQQSLLLKQRATRENPWEDPLGKIWGHMFQLMAILQRSWTDWMQGMHDAFLQFWSMFQKESTNFKRDAEAGYQSAQLALDRQYKQAAIAARQLQKSMARDLKVAQRNLVKGAKVAQKTWTKTWKETGGSAPVQRLQNDMSAARDHVLKTVAAKKKSFRVAAVNLKQAQIERAARKRVAEVQQLRAKHREMMALVRKQSKVKHRANLWVNKGKVAVYRKAIQSVQARHQVENLLGKMTSGKKKIINGKKGRKVRPKKATNGVPRKV